MIVTGKGPFVDGLINHGSGEWCWNSIAGCGPQLTVLKWMGIATVLVIVIVFCGSKE
jgi:hypothetical protein